MYFRRHLNRAMLNCEGGSNNGGISGTSEEGILKQKGIAITLESR